MFFLVLIAIGLPVLIILLITIILLGFAKDKMADIESEIKYDFDKSRDKERKNRF